MKKFQLVLLLLIIIVTCQYSTSYAQESEDCLMCHDDPEFTTEIDDKEVSLYVSEEKFMKAVHKKLKCVQLNTNTISKKCKALFFLFFLLVSANPTTLDPRPTPTLKFLLIFLKKLIFFVNKLSKYQSIGNFRYW